MIRLRPVVLLNHPGVSALAKILSPKADKRLVMERSYRQLVTRQGVAPAKAKHLLGIPQ